MRTPRGFTLALVLVLGTLTGAMAAAARHAPAQSARWTIPATAVDEENPLPSSAATLAAGKKLFAAKCQRCHGATAKGNGPDADAKYAADMDLTNPARAARNADGQVFYKIWNGRLSPKMPAFSEELTKEQAWAIVAYVQSLRSKAHDGAAD
jgi:mono/diheme cytochrome c family protein